MPHQIRNISSPYTGDVSFWQKWSSVTPRMAIFIKVTPKPFWTGVEPLGFTSNSRDMILPAHSGLIFKSTAGITPSTVESGFGMSSTMEFQGLYREGEFQPDDVLAGKWDFAQVEVFSACWDDPAMGELVHFFGQLGEITHYETHFKAEGNGLLAQLSQETGVVTSRSCRVKDFRDSECGHTASTVTISDTAFTIVHPEVTAVMGISVGTGFPDKGTFIVQVDTLTGTQPIPADFFLNGKITALTGRNAGVSREISTSTVANVGLNILTIETKRPFPFADSVAEEANTYQLIAGCSRTVEDCRKFGNIINFRGEPFVPNLEAINRVPPPTAE